MTAQQLQKLTPLEKRIKIAELCGWKPKMMDYDTGRGEPQIRAWIRPDHINACWLDEELPKELDKLEYLLLN